MDSWTIVDSAAAISPGAETRDVFSRLVEAVQGPPRPHDVTGLLRSLGPWYVQTIGSQSEDRLRAPQRRAMDGGGWSGSPHRDRSSAHRAAGTEGRDRLPRPAACRPDPDSAAARASDGRARPSRPLGALRVVDCAVRVAGRGAAAQPR